MNKDALAAYAASLAASPAFVSKCDITEAAEAFPSAPHAVEKFRELTERVPLGDDTAAIPDGDGFLLFAAEGILPEFLDRDPYFAGYSSVMVNVSDIAAMGGYPLAVVDVYFTPDGTRSGDVFAGMRAACDAYAVPLVGGHTTKKADGPHALSVAILGRAKRLLSSFGAKPGEVVLLAMDLSGAYRGDFPFWNASLGRDPCGLRANLALFSTIAERGAASACKDVSNAGIAGTLLMLFEASGVGGVLQLDAIPRPAKVELERWLRTFPSYGFLLTASVDRAPEIEAMFEERGIACARVGKVDDSRQLRLAWSEDEVLLWDLAARPFTGFGREQRRT